MNVRLGIHTVYKGIEMTVTEYYGHGLSQDVDEKHRILSYPNDFTYIEGFKEKERRFYKDIHIDELTNAFLVVTKARYRDYVFDVEPYIGDNIHVHLATRDLKLGAELNFHKLHDGKGLPYFLGEIKKAELEKMWEERMPYLDFPYPDYLPTREEIEIPK